MKVNEHLTKTYPIQPCPKPRMTRRDKWQKRPCVMRYRAFKDQVATHGVKVNPGGDHIVFRLAMPKSWSKRKKDYMRGQPHQQRPDKDNLEKALLDSLFTDDSHVWDNRVTKLWADDGSITVISGGAGMIHPADEKLKY